MKYFKKILKMFFKKITIIALVFGVLFTPSLLLAANDGDGTMTVSPSSITVGSTNNDFVFHFSNDGNSFQNTGSILTFTIPSGWTAPQETNSNNAGYVTIANTTCTNSGTHPSNGVGDISESGNTVTVTITGCGAGRGFDLQYNNLTASNAGNYTFTTATQNGTSGLTNITTSPVVTVNKITPTLSITNSPLTYNGSSQAVVITTSVAGTVSSVRYSSSSTIPTDAGTYAITANFTPTNTTNYNTLTGASAGNFTITKRLITVTAVTNTKTYDGTTSASATPTITSGSLATGDTVTWTETYSTATAGTGKTLIPAGTVNDGNGGNDYTVTFVSVYTGVINKITPIISVTNSPVTYNGSPQAVVISSSTPGFVSNVRYNGSSTVPTDVGTYTITANFTPTDTNNYNTLTGTSAGNLVVVKATPTLSINNPSVTYSGSPQAVIISSSTSGSVTNVKYNGSSTVPTNAGTYAITTNFTPTDTTNYNSLTGVSIGNFVINKATPTISITNSPVTYNGLAQSVIVTGSVAGTVSSVRYSGSSTVPSDVGTYAITANFTPTDTTNYNSLTGASAGNFTITKRLITVTAVTNTKTYDGTTSASATPTITSGSLATGDTVTWTETYSTATAGTGKTLIPAGTVNDGNGGNDYTVTFVSVYTGVITASNSTTTVTDSVDPTIVGQTYTVNVNVSRTGSGGQPSGSVTISDGTDSCTVASISGANGTSTGSCSLTSTTSGSKTLTAVYSGDINFNGSSGTTSHTVGYVDLTTGNTTPTTATVGTAITLTATITNGGNASTGVSFTTLFQKANDAIGTGAVDIGTDSDPILSAGASTPTTLSYTFTTAGTTYIRACADKSSSGNNGVIPESNENNNCGTWTAIIVTPKIDAIEAALEAADAAKIAGVDIFTIHFGSDPGPYQGKKLLANIASGNTSVTYNTFVHQNGSLSDGTGGGMVGTGYISPTAQSADTGGNGNGFELNPTNAYVDGSSYASNLKGNGDRHQYFGYNITIPPGANINGIVVRPDWWIDNTYGTNSVDIELSWDGGTTWTAKKNNANETTNDTNNKVVPNSTNDTWGRTWAANDFLSSNFRIRITTNSSVSTRNFYLDWIPVQVYYTVANTENSDGDNFFIAPSSSDIKGIFSFIGNQVCPAAQNVSATPPPTTGTIIIMTNVTNNNGGSITDLSNFSINGYAQGPSKSFPFNQDSSGTTTITVNPGSYNITEDPVDGYIVNVGAACSSSGSLGNIVAGETRVCVISNDDIPPPPPPPVLNINPYSWQEVPTAN